MTPSIDIMERQHLVGTHRRQEIDAHQFNSFDQNRQRKLER